MTTTSPRDEDAIQIRLVLNHYKDAIADIMRKYAISEPRIQPGQAAAFSADITHQIDIEQDSLLQLIHAHDAIREREIRIDIQNEGHFFTHKDMKGGAIDYGFYHFCKCGYRAGGQDELQGHIAWHIGILTNPKQQTGEK
ncbi:hypothetical protein AHiyo1_09280 [Arthrobacter sp. Hiyo1]|uniref:hypothetical protein n=1 Tax=Arthrobacter sp. Hiyo1 TaxID=1588020 RepID=UPI00072361D2|nr:hypothetical protein [Arthrobacter sp. Hiyo1]GAP57966.1 hypothetical protein AHiyo1_09280 [Arthrobacter sp. Hiyo1]